MSLQTFVHLRVHTEFSLIDSIVRVDDLVKTSRNLNMPAVAVTDQGNLYSLVKFYKAANGAGVKPVAGADLEVKAGDHTFLLTVLVMNDQGYKNLIELISRSYIRRQPDGSVVVEAAWVHECHEGLILLLGRRSDVGHALSSGDPASAVELLQNWMRLFDQDRAYLELTRTGRAGEEDFLHAAVGLAHEYDCPVVATNDVRFITPEDFEAHELRVCIASSVTLDDPRRSRDYSPQQYLKSPEEMMALFEDIPEAIENTVEIAKRCSLEVRLGKSFLPNYPVPDGMTMEEYFVAYSRECLEERLLTLLDKADPRYEEKRKAYYDRLDFELNIINQMGFPGYFLIVMDFIRWAKNNGVPVGPGRGSGAGSLVAYALKITDLDPTRYDLLFERFLNPERVSMPDFDIDFCMEGRDRVIEYVASAYGRAAVSQIITFGTMAAKAVVRDVARVLGKSYGLADRISKLIPFTPGISLEEARKEEPQLNELLSNPDERDHEDALEIWEMALKLEGITRGVGKHAGGVLIAPGKLTDFTAVYCDEEGKWVSQYDKDDVEQVGLVKFDFLGLRTLTIIDWAMKDINGKRASRGEEPIDIAHIPLDDPAAYQLLQEGRTTAVFQLESRGMKELLKKLKPSNFEDLIALVALYRPGPLESGMVDDFINRKHGRAPVAYPDATYQHACLEPVLKPTYGVIVYQEQVMQIAQVMAGYSLGGADMLRRAMGKKKPEEMAKERVKFMAGAEEQKIDKDLAGHIFDLMEKFAGYGFNKSHSAAYALVSYQTAWLKHYYPAEFMAAVMSSEMHNIDKVVTFIEECREMKLRILPPDVNRSVFKFVTTDQKEIVYGLGAIKGVGEGPIESIVEARKDGEFVDLFDFCCRVELGKVNKRTQEALVRAGALDALGPHRATIMASLDDAVAAAEQQARNQDAGMVDLFGEVMDAAPRGEFVDAPQWTDDERLFAERETLGLYLTGHPIDQYLPELRRFVQRNLSDLEPTRRGEAVIVAGLVLSVRIMKGMRGTRAFVLIDDRSGRVEVTLFNESYEAHRHLLNKDMVVVIEGEVSFDEYAGGLKMVSRKVLGLAEARAVYGRALQLNLDGARLGLKFGADLKQLLQSHRPQFEAPGLPVKVHYSRPDAEVDLALGPDWKVAPTEDLMKRLRQQFGEQAAVLVY